MAFDIPVNTNDINISGYNVDRSIIAFIKEASDTTGVSFDYLLAKAGQESKFTKNAKTRTSSARGIYQFTISTWLDLFKKYGAKYGHANLAKNIKKDKFGRSYVSDSYSRKTILALRSDPRMSAMLAAEYARNNQVFLENSLNKNVTLSDLYLSHFLGPLGALKLIEAEKYNKWQAADKLFPAAARANEKIFYKLTSSGWEKPRNVAEVRKILDSIFNKALKQFTNIPAATVAALPRLLPAGDASLSGPSGKYFAAPLNKDNKKLEVQVINMAALDLDNDDKINEMDFSQKVNGINLTEPKKLGIFTAENNSQNINKQKNTFITMSQAQEVSMLEGQIIPYDEKTNEALQNITLSYNQDKPKSQFMMAEKILPPADKEEQIANTKNMILKAAEEIEQESVFGNAQKQIQISDDVAYKISYDTPYKVAARILSTTNVSPSIINIKKFS